MRRGFYHSDLDNSRGDGEQQIEQMGEGNKPVPVNPGTSGISGENISVVVSGDNVDGIELNVKDMSNILSADVSALDMSKIEPESGVRERVQE